MRWAGQGGAGRTSSNSLEWVGRVGWDGVVGWVGLGWGVLRLQGHVSAPAPRPPPSLRCTAGLGAIAAVGQRTPATTDERCDLNLSVLADDDDRVEPDRVQPLLVALHRHRLARHCILKFEHVPQLGRAPLRFLLAMLQLPNVVELALGPDPPQGDRVGMVAHEADLHAAADVKVPCDELIKAHPVALRLVLFEEVSGGAF